MLDKVKRTVIMWGEKTEVEGRITICPVLKMNIALGKQGPFDDNLSQRLVGLYLDNGKVDKFIINLDGDIPIEVGEQDALEILNLEDEHGNVERWGCTKVIIKKP